MNLLKHYDLYRAAILRDALDEGSWYAKQVKTAGGTTVYDWLYTKVEEIKEAVRSNRADAYVRAVSAHQSAMIDLYEAMVTDHLWDYRRVGPQELLDLIDEQGTNWFKFCKRHIKFSVTLDDGSKLPMLWVPRHIYPWLGMATSGSAAVFDADELHFMSKNMHLAKAMLVAKMTAANAYKILDEEEGTRFQGFRMEQPWRVNNEVVVRDWTAPLFFKEGDMQG